MQFVTDPAIATKILKMEQRVRWRDPFITQRGIDQTSLHLDDGQAEQNEFSFLVVGDSGSGSHRSYNPQRRIAEQMLAHREQCRFVLHTGDVIYLVGSSEYYPKNFIQPYREFLVNGDRPKQIAYDQMVFNFPFFLVPGNHDYYDLPRLYGWIAQAALPLRYLLRSQLDFDVGWHGSYQGDAYACAFLDYLKRIGNNVDLERHLEQHYTATLGDRRCLRYQTGQFTRLPNRYYTFRYGGIDFFALDSNTFNAPNPLPSTPEGERSRERLRQKRAELEQEQRQIMATATRLNPVDPEHVEQLDDLKAKVEQLAEVIQDIDKQLQANENTVTDDQQLEWLQQRLIESWHTEAVRGRVLFFHHPPYVTEATKWHQAQTMIIRDRLRQVLDAVAQEVGELTQGRPIVDLVLAGHAHCLEYLRTLDTGHADSHTNWIVCGGSGYSLRRQRQEGAQLTERFSEGDRVVAESRLFIGRSGQGSHKRRPYSFLRIDVRSGTPPKFVIRPYIAEWFQRSWQEREVEPLVLP
ncbi:metallophosphoesterase [Pantanalinema sp. GBBB05]|uniref:metallophosphoesterase n=1 Tax=Pantanalinema sp. GBBB05 TaxID=2604139 RepID=UPI001D6BA390|nr:metallophosphoesterase [Pantanalinema sp. GBBB05]